MSIAGSVLIVIVNYRTGGLTVDCLRSLAGEVASRPGTRVDVVDNCSADGSAELIAAAIEREGWAGWATLRRAPVNGGFSYGNNFAARPALASADPPAAIWLLNPDTEVRPGALNGLLDFLERHPWVGIVGSAFEWPDGRVWPHAFRFPTMLSELASGLRLRAMSALLKNHEGLLTMGEQAERVDWLPGASMMVRREVFESVGLMDEGYFLYYEETDFCLAARRANWECWYVPQSRVMHHAGKSTGVSGVHRTVNRRPQYWFDSRRRYFIKNHGWLYAALTDLVWSLSFLTLKLRSKIQRKPIEHPPFYLRDFLRHSALFHTDMPMNAVVAGARHEET